MRVSKLFEKGITCILVVRASGAECIMDPSAFRRFDFYEIENAGHSPKCLLRGWRSDNVATWHWCGTVRNICSMTTDTIEEDYVWQ